MRALQAVFQGVMGLAFVQPDMGASAQVRVEHPIDDEERALNAADFAKRRGEIMLARIRRKLAQQLDLSYRTGYPRWCERTSLQPLINLA